MSITVTPTTPEFFAEISGIDLAQPLQPADRDAIEDAINRYAVVVFRGQKLSDAQQIDFAAQFRPDPFLCPAARGTPASSIAWSAPSSPTSPTSTATARCSTSTPSAGSTGWPIACGTPTPRSAPFPARCRCSMPMSFPDEGGDTEFADMRAAYDALPDSNQEAARRPDRRFIRSGIRAGSST